MSSTEYLRRAGNAEQDEQQTPVAVKLTVPLNK